MLISTRGRYALRVLVDIAEHPVDGYMPLQQIARRQEISEKYLESIIRLLVRAKLLTGLRGKGGGYKLTRPPQEYSIGEVLRLTEESLAPVHCLETGAKPCGRAVDCPTLPLWRGLNEVIAKYLNGYTLADLVRLRSNEDNEMSVNAQHTDHG